jgi:hypothetical protein
VTELRGAAVLLRPVSERDVGQLRRIRYTPKVRRWWGQDEADDWPLGDNPDVTPFTGAGRRPGRRPDPVRGGHGPADRLVIDPATANDAAIRCYNAVGFRPVGVMRAYERDTDGDGWHDGLLMDLLAAELT